MKAVVSTVMSKLSSPAQECYFSRSNENAIEGNRFYMIIEKF